ncbi:MAG: phosphotransferase [Candidatus Nanopelagicales bacterium]
MHPAPIPRGQTAHRPNWEELASLVRELIESRLGQRVVAARSQGGGFTPGFASVLTCADGSGHFVKAATDPEQPEIGTWYREEIRKLGALPRQAPAPRLLWGHDDGRWVILGIEFVAARAPQRPWRYQDLAACLRLTEQLAAALTPPPSLDVPSFATEFAAYPALWEQLRAQPPSLPGLPAHLDEARELAAGFAQHTNGNTWVHCDLRDDNLLLTPDGRALACDWNWPVVGAAWIDTLMLLVGPRGDGLDVAAVLRDHPLTAEVSPEAVDSVLALLTGYLLTAGAAGPIPGSPHLRTAQLHQGVVCWGWLAERRGWA